MADKTRARGPGLAKARGAPLLRRRIVQLVATSDGRLRELFDVADVVSEGQAREENGALVYYGSTSLLLAVQLAPTLALVAPLDPHVRLRAVRIARREALARAGGHLGTLHAEVSFGAAGAATLTASASPPLATLTASASPPLATLTASASPRLAPTAVVSVTVDVTAVVLRGRARSTMPP